MCVCRVSAKHLRTIAAGRYRRSCAVQGARTVRYDRKNTVRMVENVL